MHSSSQPWTDQRIEQAVGNLLRFGVLTAAAVVGIGAVLYLLQYGATIPDYEHFQREPAAFRRVTEIIADAASFDGKAVIQFGVLLLLATPIARVILSVGAFALQRDRLYVLITLTVLAVLGCCLAGL